MEKQYLSISKMGEGDTIPDSIIYIDDNGLLEVGLKQVCVKVVFHFHYGNVWNLEASGFYTGNPVTRIKIQINIFNAYNELISTCTSDHLEMSYKRKKTIEGYLSMKVPDDEYISRITCIPIYRRGYK